MSADHQLQIYQDDEVQYVLRLAFGHPVPYAPMPVAAGTGGVGLAFALYDPAAPPHVLLLRYHPNRQSRAFRAYTVLRALAEQHFVVPQTYLLGWSYHLRYTLLLLEYVQGRGVEGQPAAFFGRVGDDFARTLARLHQLPWRTLPDLPVTPLAYALHELTALVRRLQTPQLLLILDWLLERVTDIAEYPQTVTHGDYTLNNIIADGINVAAVYGWENAVIADPRFDVGYASAWLGSHEPLLSSRFITSYTDLAGPVHDLVFWEVLSALRLLSRVARTLSTLPESGRTRFLQDIGHHWTGLLHFVALRTDLPLI